MMSDLPAIRASATDDQELRGTTTGSALADVLEYPGEYLDERLDEAVRQLTASVPAAGEQLARFREAMATLTLEQRQELFTRTFDINPVCSLEIGWQLFGEEYHRGALLVRLRGELRRYGIEESTELPDHLTHVLPLLDRMPPHEAEEFAACCVRPAVEKMLAAFAEQSSPYGDVLRAVGLFVKRCFRLDSAPRGGVA